MKSFYEKNPVSILALILLFIGLYSCKKDETVTKTPVQIAAADSLEAYPGLNRITLRWEVNDDAAKKAVAYCDNGDSVVVSYSGTPAMTATFSDLKDGNYSFSVYLFDSQGNISARAKIVTRVYGERYIHSLSSRTVENAIFVNGQVNILWQAPPDNSLGTNIHYVNTSGDTLSVYIDRNTDSITLENYKPGTYFTYRTLYKPVPEAIDTFYASFSSAKDFSTFFNPLFTNKGADPWVVYQNGMYYFTYTTGGSIVLYATPKMIDVGKAQPVTAWRPPSGTDYSGEVWAPEMHFLDNKWYIYFAADNGQDINHRMFVLENTSPDPLQGTWEFKGELQEPSDQWAIDGTVLQYNGELYMIWSGKTDGAFPQNLYIAKMSNPYTLDGSRVLISTPENSWEKNGAPINEGPEILKNKAGNIFLVYSASGFWTDDYCLGMLSLKTGGDPMNPADWAKSPDPVLKELPDAGAYGTGHCSFFKSRDSTEDWIIYHARSLPNGGSTNHRNPRMQKINWNADGTPHFGQPVKINEEVAAPSGEF